MFYLKIEDINAIREALRSFTDYVEKVSPHEEDIANGKLIACELISNVLKHSKCTARLYARAWEQKLEITVETCGPCLPARRIQTPSTDTASGRGLFIVNTLCESLMLEKTKTIAVMRLNKI